MLRNAAVGVLSLLLANFAFGQQSPPGTASASAAAAAVQQLSPSEAYKYATQPYFDARNAPNDLTEADQWALGQAITRAQQQCEALKKLPLQPPPFDTSGPGIPISAGQTVMNRGNVPKEYAASILDLGRLCTFGQDLEPAREALVDYLSLPGIEDAKTAHLLLARVFVGLGWYPSAESQMESLVSLYPYDGDTHLAIDETIDAAEAGGDTGVVARLNDLQLPYTMKALSTGGTIKGKENQIDAATLVNDALRCAVAMRDVARQKGAAAALVAQVRELASAPAISQTASKPEIDNALARYAMVGQPAEKPLGSNLRGDLILKTGHTVPAAKLLTGKTTVIIAVSLGAPASADILARLMAWLQQSHLEKSTQVLAITSYAATNSVEKKSDAVLKALTAFAATMPANAPLLLVPDATIKAFNIDAYPAAVVVNPAGRIVFLNLIPGTNGSIHQLLQAAIPRQLSTG